MIVAYTFVMFCWSAVYAGLGVPKEISCLACLLHGALWPISMLRAAWRGAL